MSRRALNIFICMVAALLLVSGAEAKPKSGPPPLQQIGYPWIDSSKTQGKVVYLDFFASWCAPCALSFPFMKSLNSAYADSGLVIIAVDLDKDSSEAALFLDRMKPPFTVVEDQEGVLAKQFDLKAMPTSYLYGRDGTVREVHQGFAPADTSTIRADIVALLHEAKKP